jgi:DNA (cytosine-5)-methyltransferase 1
MIANAVPAPVAKAIGEVILARHHGHTVPAIEGRFLDWLSGCGRNRATARNIKSSVNRARRLLGGRTFADIAMEIVALEAVADFDKLLKGTRSDLRQALRLHAEFLESKASRAKRRRAAVPVAVAADAAELAEAA